MREYAAGAVGPGVVGWVGAGGQAVGDVAKKPRLAKGAAGDHDAVAAGDGDHVGGVVGGGDVAVADDGNVGVVLFDRLNHCGDAFEANRGFEFHGGGAAVHGDHAGARVAEAWWQGVGDDGVVVPAQADFGGDRHVDCVDHGLGEGDGVVGVAKQLGAAMFFGDFIDGAAHVDVDDGGAVRLGPSGGLGENDGVAAVELHAHRQIVRAGGGSPHGFVRFFEQAVGAEQFGKGQAQCAVGAVADVFGGAKVLGATRHAGHRAGHQAVGEVEVTCDRGQQEVGFKMDGSNAEHGMSLGPHRVCDFF